MKKRPPTVADLLANRGKHQYAMLRVETMEEAEAAALAGVEMFSIPAAMIHDPRFREVAPTAFAFPGDNFYEIGDTSAFMKWAMPLFKAGADGFYCSGSLKTVREMAEHALPVCGHVGLIPSKATWTGGFKAVGKTLDSAKWVWDACVALQDAGAFAVEIEVVPHQITQAIAEKTDLFLAPMRNICSLMTCWARTAATFRATPRFTPISMPNMRRCRKSGSRPCGPLLMTFTPANTPPRHIWWKLRPMSWRPFATGWAISRNRVSPCG
jgi:hypothetical protein